MLGYTLAYSRIYKQVQEKRSQLPPKQKQELAPVILPRGTEPFATVIARSSGKKVLPLDSVTEPALEAIALAADATMSKLNEPTSPLIGLRRINEASRFFEDSMRELLDSQPNFTCEIPTTKEGNKQRSGYPDLIITHKPTGRIFYLDPKLYEASSENSSLRTFYYTPRSQTSKILKSAHHLLIGFAHDGRDGSWQFESWKLVDLSQTQLTLKSEFNASNKDLYQEASVIRESP